MSVFCQALRLQFKRYQYRRRAARALRDCWQLSPPCWQSPARDAAYLAIDLEMTSLDPSTGEVVSIGWVPITHCEIDLSAARHHLLRAESLVGESAVIHQLRDCDRVGGEPPEEVLQALLKAASGRVLLFHCAELDIAFLNALCQTHLAAPLLLPYVDTLQIEHGRRERAHQPVRNGELRLADCREHYHLPAYPAHNALSDALATAELFLAIKSR